MELAARYYERAEAARFHSSETEYRLGSAYYHLGRWEEALLRFFNVSMQIPANRRLLGALGNVSFMRGDHWTAQGYYTRLLDILETDRGRYPRVDPAVNPEHADLVERLMVTRNNLGASFEALSRRTGTPAYRSRALASYAESARLYDGLARDPVTLLRPGTADLATPGVNLAYLNTRDALYPLTGTLPQIYLQIDRDIVEPSDWETLIAGE
jgi:tetratricopeptide (TPR) repeat protein